MTFKFRKPAIVAASTLLLALVTVVLMTPSEPQIEAEEAQPPVVSVLTVQRSELNPKLTIQANTQARWPLQLKATSSARLDYLGADMEPGNHIKKGQVLARLNTRLLESQLAQAQSTVKQAELNLQQQLHEQQVAKTMRPGASSAFARMEPHVAAARSELARAQQNVESARQLLDDAIIVAPYDAVITQRLVSPGEWLEAGQTLFEVVASDSIDVHVPLSQRDWNKVGATLGEQPITVVSRTGVKWPAFVRYLSPQVNAMTRQRTLVLAVSEPYQHSTRLLPNQQVAVHFELITHKGLYKLPLSAVDPDQTIWIVTEAQQLRQVPVQVIEVRGDKVIASLEGEQPDTLQLVRYPLRSMMAGKRVSTQPDAVQVADKQEAL
ncbi:efflux transporter periplasmic adaptor subunit [Pseudoalteromonas rubra]|uniref:Efflux transporter periplasmic adaptor subunit n=1 Tax=Pseudoalteromonas rubra TaxID=43658 RepID=A0A4V2E3R7_9GAMM|nr:efflux RND transporter periplasmic adaptor subunit [Pseudoalteromonas rubra]RZM83380.1 efflux transporter periplasmic adaptor subunit [Pseudoalteromonas rubra]